MRDTAAEWARHPLHRWKLTKARRDAWRNLFPEGATPPLDHLPPEARLHARDVAELIAKGHESYTREFNACTEAARELFEARAWPEASHNAEARAALYRSAVNGMWARLKSRFGEHLPDPGFWMAVRQAYLERVFDRYDADLALTFLYSCMRIALAQKDVPVEYADDGLTGRSHIWSYEPIWRTYDAAPDRLGASIVRVLLDCGFRAAFENAERDGELVAKRLVSEWHTQVSSEPPRELQVLKPVFFRDCEAYVAGKMLSPRGELPVVLALTHGPEGIAVDAVLAGKEDMRNILFVSTRSTFHVRTDKYRELLEFVDTMAPERGHPAMCAVIGFTHPARVALNQAVRRHVDATGEKFEPAPGRIGMAMIVFSPPSFPYVFKVVRDYSSKQAWAGRERIIDLYRWVHEMNRGRLMLDAWLYRNLHFPRRCFDERVVRELTESAPSSVRVDNDTVVLKHVYAQRRVLPLNSFFQDTTDRSLRERAADALGTFVKDLARMGFFLGDHYGMPFNTGLTHGFNVTLFDFDDLGPLLRFRFRSTPHLPDEQAELMWNTEADGAWFTVEENDVLVDEWERYLGIPPDLREYFEQRHADLFTTEYWEEAQQRVASGELQYVQPYPPDRRLAKG